MQAVQRRTESSCRGFREKAGERQVFVYSIIGIAMSVVLKRFCFPPSQKKSPEAGERRSRRVSRFYRDLRNSLSQGVEKRMLYLFLNMISYLGEQFSEKKPNDHNKIFAQGEVLR